MPAAAEEVYGGNKVVETICRLNPDLLAETCQHILIYLQGQSRGVDSAQIAARFQRVGVQLDQQVSQSLVRFLLLTFRSAGNHKLSSDELVSKLEDGSNKWSKAALQVLHGQWSDHGAAVQAQQEAQDALSIGQLVDLQWKLGMAVSSDSCRALDSPFVTVQLKMAEPSGQISQRSFEMSVPQFQNFHKQVKEMAAVMETV